MDPVRFLLFRGSSFWLCVRYDQLQRLLKEQASPDDELDLCAADIDLSGRIYLLIRLYESEDDLDAVLAGMSPLYRLLGDTFKRLVLLARIKDWLDDCQEEIASGLLSEQEAIDHIWSFLMREGSEQFQKRLPRLS